MTADRRHMSWGVALERAGIWAFAVIAAWVGYSIQSLTKEMNEFRTQLAVSLETQKASIKRTENIENDVKKLKAEVDNVYSIQQWAFETFHSTRMPKAFEKWKN